MTPAIEDYAVKKVSSLEKFFGNDKDTALCEVELGKTTGHHKTGDIFRAEINIVRPGQNQFYAVAEESDLYAAIDVVRDQIEREIVAKKEKRETLFRRGATRFKSFFRK